MKTLRDYVKIAEAAAVLGISQNTLRKWADDGKMPVCINPVNRYRLFRRADLKRFIDKVALSGARRRLPR